MTIAAAILAAFFVSAAVSSLLARGRLGWLHVLDHPNERSLHLQPVPRSGGVAVLAGFFATIPIVILSHTAGPELVWLLTALIAVAGVSFLDDRFGLSRRLRFSIHLVAATLLWFGGLRWELLGLPGMPILLPLPLALPMTLLYSVWMLNLYNFMDGMDGLAGGMAAVGFGALGVLGLISGDPFYAACCFALAAASVGFLTANWPPARIFLGDVGSSSLGLLAAGLTLWGASERLFPMWAGLLIFSPFIVDATWTLLRRAASGQRIWEAHRSHHYQRLVLAGWGHRRTLGWALVLIVSASATAVAATGLSVTDQWVVLFAWASVFVLVHVRVGLAERNAGVGR